MVNEERLLKEFMELVQIDSETKQEGTICQFLTKKLQQLGLYVKEDDSQERTGHGSGNLIATLAGHSQAPCVYFTSHMDTVSPGLGIQPEVRDGYVYSDGTTILGSDDKAGIAAMLEGLRVLKEQDVEHGPIQIIITAGEESGLVGAKALNPKDIVAEFGFAFDSSGPVGDIIVAAPTQAKIKTIVYGKSAHAGLNPEDGISAIQVASKAISNMSLGRIDAQTTANIGSFAGGQATNVVCDYVEITAEARSLDDHKMNKQTQRMKDCFEQAAQQFHTKVDVQTEILYPSFQCTEKDEVVQVAVEAVKRIQRKPQLLSSGGGSDANVFAGYGIPTVNMGLGYEYIHTKNERIAIAELNKAAELFVSLVQVVALRDAKE